MSNSEGRSLVDSASTWIQVVFGGLGVSVAIVALVIAYFAWVQPHSPDGDKDQAAPPPAAPTTRDTAATGTPAPATIAGVSLGRLTPVVGAGNIRSAGGDLVIHCATGQNTDRQRSVGYDLLGRYAAMRVEVRVSKARDNETPLQLKIFADDVEVANQVVTKAKSSRSTVPLDGRQKMRVQLTCQFPDGEIILGDPELAHA